MKKDFANGFKCGLPIAFGYFPVSFAFGLMAVSGAISPVYALFISISNFTSAGQFAGTNLIMKNSMLIEIALATLVINLRYMLMSLSLTQKLPQSISLKERLIVAFGITDETFAMALTRPGEISCMFFTGLYVSPYIGWVAGTFCGCVLAQILPLFILNAAGISLYAMFIALIIFPARKSKAVLLVVICAAILSIILFYLPIFYLISSGWKIMITTILISALGALLFPIREEANSNE